MPETEELVLLGGGYGNMLLLSTLLPELPAHVHVTLVDRLPKSPLKTEFYSLAAGTASHKEVTVPFAQHPQVSLIFDEVLGVDRREQRVQLRENDSVRYDRLVIGLGCVDRFHGIPGADVHSLSVQSLKRAQLTGQAILTLDAYRQVVLVGAGLTGVELAAELRESRPDLKIALIDRHDLVLNGFSHKLREYVERWLRNHDIQVIHGFSTTSVEAGEIRGGDTGIAFDQLVWTAGIQANPLVQKLDVPLDSIGRATVDEWQRVPGDDHVYVIGDCAASSYPPSAQLAEFQGAFVAHTLISLWHGETPVLEQFASKGTLGSLGHRAGFGEVKGVKLGGKVARLLKSGVLWSYKKHVE